MSVKCILQGQTPEATSSVTSITSGENMLRNAYLSDPVNSRGSTTYTGQQYHIDGWQFSTANTGNLVINDEFITVSQTTSGTNAYLLQHLEMSQFKQLARKTITVSCLARVVEDGLVDFYSYYRHPDGNKSFCYNTLPADGEWHCVSATDVIAEEVTTATYNEICFRVRSGSVDIKAVKWEVGSSQTLAHQDENGEWVLNDPPPDKNLELLKCCMSTADSGDTYANNKVTPAAVGAVNKAGDTMNGNLVMKNVTVNDGVNNQTVLTAYDDGDSVNYGCELVISGNGNTFVGAGESAKNLRNTFINGGDLVGLETWEQIGEKLYICSDNDIFFETGCQTIANRKCFIFYRTGSFYSPSGMVWGGKGSYTGNGSSTTRTIKIGNGGNCLLIWDEAEGISESEKNALFVVPTGAFGHRYNYTLAYGNYNITFANGILTLNTNSYGNYSGRAYNYILLG